MRLSARQLNRSTLDRQLLLRRAPLDVAEAVRQVVALQAQQAASPYLALWNRVSSFDPADLDAAFAEQRVVKATLMRITLHAVHVHDYAVFHDAMQPTLRAARLGDRRFRDTGLSVDEADAVVPEVLQFASQPRTNAEFEAWCDERLGALPKPGVWWALRSYAPLLHAPTASPWSFGHRPAYVAAGIPPSSGGGTTSEASLQTLVRRYLAAFGPASVADVAQFALVQRARVRQAIDALSDDLEQVAGPAGEGLYDVPNGPRVDADVPAPPRLMAMWDSILLAYGDRSRVIPPEYRKAVIRSNGDVLPTVLVDGYVAGVWRPTCGGIEVAAFHALPAEAWDGLAAEATVLLALLAEREPDVYRRYERWWTRLPDVQVRVLP